MADLITFDISGPNVGTVGLSIEVMLSYIMVCEVQRGAP